nr:immunoglobulin heavy chain junction region [Macaca mulatta]MOW88059.1 immunoglobulin heavy chain junction region [Macaca mulatta]MOW88666.1 immunoglobulin heavy chain junction region [Macaca mulatta]MOW89667.1 immunoglobulin heavy chain junction region [Macaca mulatta]MOW91669.1 immunoglobulin heavy chain junction region [Macaca mulatta]
CSRVPGTMVVGGLDFDYW